MEAFLAHVFVGLMLGIVAGMFLSILDKVIESRSNMVLAAVLVGISLVYISNFLDSILFGG